MTDLAKAVGVYDPPPSLFPESKVDLARKVAGSFLIVPFIWGVLVTGLVMWG